MSPNRELVAAVDVGTQWTKAAVGRFTPEGKLEIYAFSSSLTKGVRNGVVVNIDEVSASIRSVVNKLEEGIRLKIRKIYSGISGQKIYNRSYECYRMTTNGVVTQENINALIDEASSYFGSQNEKVYHIIPQDFIVDGEHGINNPVGIAGRKIEAFFTVITASDNYEANLKRSIEKAGLELASAFINPFVQGTSLLSKDEKEAGVILIDFGAGTTGVSMYYENKLRIALELPFGGNVISNDIREGCNIIPRHAEMVKLQFGHSFAELVPENKYAQIPEVDGWPAKDISWKNLAGIIQARLEEIIEGVNYQIESTGLQKKLGAGIVLTGGGSKMADIDKLVSYLTGFDVRFGKPSVVLKEQLFNSEILDIQPANLLGILINGLFQTKRLNYPPGMIVSEVKEEVKKSVTVKKSNQRIGTFLSDIFGKAKDGLTELISDDDQEN